MEQAIYRKGYGRWVLSLLLAMVLALSLLPTLAFADEKPKETSIPATDQTAMGWYFAVLEEKGIAQKDTTSAGTGYVIKGKSKNSSIHKGEEVVVITAVGTASTAPGTTKPSYNINKIQFHPENFKTLRDEDQRNITAEFIKNLQNSDVSKQTQQKLFDDMNNASPEISRLIIPMLMDASSADVYGAMRVVSPFLPLLRVILGIIAIGVVFSLGFFTAMDLFFIGIPFFRDKMQSKGDERGGKIPFVSYDAVSVVNETESGTGDGGYKNPVIMYFKRRALTIIAVGVCLVYLVFGGLGALFSGFMSLFSGFTL
jgi:hypothetical protein